MATVTIITQPAQVPTVGSGGQQAGSATEANRTPALQPGALVSGTIAGKDTAGNYLLRTSQGTFTLRSTTPLTYNSDVTIRVDAANAGSSSARIITVNGEPFATFSAPSPQEGDTVSPNLLAQTQPQTEQQVPTTPAPAAAPAALETAPPPLPVNALSAVVVSPASAQQAQTADTGATNTPVANGTNVVIRVTATPQATTEQTSTTTITQPVRPDSPATPQAVQVQTTGQQIAQDQTPASVGKLAGPQGTNIQQNPQTPANAQAPEEILAEPQPQTLQAQTPVPTTPQGPQAQPAAANVLYAAYAKQSPVPTPPQTNAPTTPQAAPQATTNVPGQVVSANADGTVTVQTPLGSVTVQVPPATAESPSPLVPGATVNIELPTSSLTLAPQTPAITIPQSTTPAALPELATSWTTLKNILTLVAATDPATAGSTTATAGNAASPAAAALLARLPQLGPDFAATSINFLQAMGQGDLRKILGDDTIESLRSNTRADLIEKFSGELDSLNQTMNTAQARQTPTWQAMFLPFVYQEELQQARLYVKRDAPKKERGSGGQSKGDTRFVVEVDLSELGPLQMDGLVREKQDTTAFDLVIRSHTPFSREDQSAIAAIYQNAAELTGFSGNVGFQVTHDFPVKPLEEAAYGDRSITV